MRGVLGYPSNQENIKKILLISQFVSYAWPNLGFSDPFYFLRLWVTSYRDPQWIIWWWGSLSLYMASIKRQDFFQNCYRKSYRTFPVFLEFRPNIPIKDDISSWTKPCTSYNSSPENQKPFINGSTIWFSWVENSILK